MGKGPPSRRTPARPRRPASPACCQPARQRPSATADLGHKDAYSEAFAAATCTFGGQTAKVLICHTRSAVRQAVSYPAKTAFARSQAGQPRPARPRQAGTQQGEACCPARPIRTATPVPEKVSPKNAHYPVCRTEPKK